MIRTRCVLAAAAALCLALVSRPASAQLYTLPNGGFEEADPTTDTGARHWNVGPFFGQPGVVSGTYSVTRDTTVARSGAASLRVDYDLTATAPTHPGPGTSLFQHLLPIVHDDTVTVPANVQMNGTGAIFHSGGDPLDRRAQFHWGLQLLSGSPSVGSSLGNAAIVDQWSVSGYGLTDVFSSTVGNPTIFLSLTGRDIAYPARVAGTVWIDDLTFTVVPEPAAASALCVGAALAMSRRRRSRP